MWASCTVLLGTLLLSSGAFEQTWRPCTDLLPLDLLDRVLHWPGQAPPPQVHMVQSRGSRGLQLSGSEAAALHFPASQIFTNCDHFPEEFSLVVTFKIQRLRIKRNEYILSLVDKGSDSVLLALRVSTDHLHFLFMRPGTSRRSRVTFKDVQLDNNRWHTVNLAVTGHHVILTVDCGLPLEIKQSQPFPSSLTTKGARFYVGSRGRPRGSFSGLLRQMVLLPGSDASLRLCPSTHPSLSELSIPASLKTVPLQDHSQVYPYEAEVRVTLGTRPECSSREQGQLWFNAALKALYLCDGSSWSLLLHSKQRLDYVEDYQDLYTTSETFDVEVFSIPNEGLFMATANRDSRSGSVIYKWISGSFQKYQNISTQEARAWKHLTINGKDFLVVANSAEVQLERSVLYRWSRARSRFVQHQTIETHSALDWEAFRIHNHSFLVVANHRRARDSNHNIHSVIYRWNPVTKRLEVNQTLLTQGAYDWEFFSVGPYHFLAVANTFDGRTTSVSSTVYMWNLGQFQHFQDIPTLGAVDWEAFTFDGRYFLAVANSQRVSERGQIEYSINSTVYELNPLTQSFLRFQDILTHSAVDWEFFTVGEEKFLVVGNSHDGTSYSLNSVIYRWQGYEGFVPVHSLPTFGCRDWEHYETSEGSFLVYSSATSRLSKVFRLKTY